MSKWKGSFVITKVFNHGVVDLEKMEGRRFTITGERIKIYLGHAESVHDGFEAYLLDEV